MDIANQFMVQTTLSSIMFDRLEQIHSKGINGKLSPSEIDEYKQLELDVISANKHLTGMMNTVVSEMLEHKHSYVQRIQECEQWIVAASNRLCLIVDFLEDKGIMDEFVSVLYETDNPLIGDEE